MFFSRSGMHSQTEVKNGDEKMKGTVHAYFEHDSFEVREECVERQGVYDPALSTGPYGGPQGARSEDLRQEPNKRPRR